MVGPTDFSGVYQQSNGVFFLFFLKLSLLFVLLFRFFLNYFFKMYFILFF